MNMLSWLMKWYESNCNGDWEHEYGVSIGTLDNPGWSITIDLIETSLEGYETEFLRVENSEKDWYDFRFHKNKFSAGGDPTKLEFLLKKFREVAEEKS
jgi:hypothetical protein